MKVYVVADVKSADGTVWELRGVFSTEAKAVAACELTTDCVMPIEMDAIAPRETTVLPEAYYPVPL